MDVSVCVCSVLNTDKPSRLGWLQLPTSSKLNVFKETAVNKHCGLFWGIRTLSLKHTELLRAHKGYSVWGENQWRCGSCLLWDLCCPFLYCQLSRPNFNILLYYRAARIPRDGYRTETKAMCTVWVQTTRPVHAVLWFGWPRLLPFPNDVSFTSSW